MPRLFVAVPIPEAVQRDLALLQTRMAGARWAKPSQMHLTLRFIGEAIDSDYHRYREALQEIAVPAFSLQLKGIGHFPPRGTPRVLWVGVADPAPLQALQSRVEKTLIAAGLPADKHAYTPHLTLARLERTPAEAVGEFIVRNNLYKSEPFPVTEYRLYSSKLQPGGVEHTLEAAYPLIGPA